MFGSKEFGFRVVRFRVIKFWCVRVLGMRVKDFCGSGYSGLAVSQVEGIRVWRFFRLTVLAVLGMPVGYSSLGYSGLKGTIRVVAFRVLVCEAWGSFVVSRCFRVGLLWFGNIGSDPCFRVFG